MSYSKKIRYSVDSSKKKVRFKGALLETTICAAVALVLAFLITTFALQLTHVGGSSMYPTLSNSDYILVEKISYRFEEPERFDVIVFPYVEESGEIRNYIKRVIGLPGETIQIKDGIIYINGEVISEDFGFETINTGGWAENPVEIGMDEYFVLGDNRNNSKDSRHLDEYGSSDIGLIEKEKIIGKAWLRIYPLGKIGKVQ